MHSESRYLVVSGTKIRSHLGEAGRRSTAYHEAGHAVAAVVTDVPFACVEIFDRPTLVDGIPVAGIVRDTQSTGWWDGVHCFAGPLADARYRRTNLATVLLSGGSGDLESARDAARPALHALLTPEQVKESIDFGLREYERHARELVREHWPWIERVARALVRRGRLTFASVRRLRS